ncbi:MAG: protein kinase, partial [Myxococcales bacterium]|nr:protein kinase [Myxococcales bacterium]
DREGNEHAVKLLHGRLSLMARVQPLWKQLEALGELSHPHIVVPNASDWTTFGRFLMAMDRVRGRDLHAVLGEHGRLPAAQTLLVIGQVCLALETAHESGLVHGALKPHNVLLVPRTGGSISTRVTDFGLSTLSEQASLEGASAAYLAPEQFDGNTSAAADVYALGVLLYEMLCGRRPFVGSDEELEQQHREVQPEMPDTIPEGLRATIARAMAKDPAARFASVSELREALETWAASSPQELQAAPLVLFAKDEVEAGVAESNDTVRVPMDDLSELFDEETVASLSESTFALEEPSEPKVSTADSQPAVRAVPKVIASPQTAGTSEYASVARSSDTLPAVGGNGSRATDAEHEKLAAREQSAASNMESQTVPTKNETDTTSVAPEDAELAAMADQASASLRRGKEVGKAAAKAPRPEAPIKQPPASSSLTQRAADAYFDEPAPEFDVERSVKAFVANIQPSVDGGSNGAGGESLDDALELFVDQAREWNTSLPAPIVDDSQLADLARVPVVEPEPEPEPEPAPPPPQVITAPPPSAMTTAPLSAPPAESKSPVPMMLVAFVLGGLLVFLGTKYLLRDRKPNTAGSAAAAAGSADPAGSAATASATAGSATAAAAGSAEGTASGSA